MNERWADSVENGEGREHIASMDRQYIEDHIREGSFLDALKEPDNVTIDDCERSVNSYNPIIVDEVTDGMWAMPVDFTGSTRNEAVRQPKYAITINRIQTATATYDTDDIRMSRKPVLDLLKRDMGDALIEAKDRVLVVSVETAVWFMFKDYSAGNAANGLNVTNIDAGTVTEYSVYKSAAALEVVDAAGDPDDTFVIQAPRKVDFTDFQNAFNTPEGEQLVGAQLLITNYDSNRTSDWTLEEVGDETVKNTVETMKPYRKFKDFSIVRTGKHRWLRPGNVYGFAPWTHLGRYVQMDSIRTFQDARGTKVEQFAWMYLGLGYGNLMSLKKKEFYSASSTPSYEDTGYAAVRPKMYDNVIRNNRVDTGNWAPKFATA
jgi:hypothetical protein